MAQDKFSPKALLPESGDNNKIIEADPLLQVIDKPSNLLFNQKFNELVGQGALKEAEALADTFIKLANFEEDRKDRESKRNLELEKLKIEKEIKLAEVSVNKKKNEQDFALGQLKEETELIKDEKSNIQKAEDRNLAERTAERTWYLSLSCFGLGGILLLFGNPVGLILISAAVAIWTGKSLLDLNKKVK